MFLKINGRILDSDKHDRELFLLRKLVSYELYESLRKYGFSRFGGSLAFRNPDLGVCVYVKFVADEAEPA